MFELFKESVIVSLPISQLEMLSEFDVRFHTKLREPNWSCFFDCTKQSSIYRHELIVTYWALMKHQALLTIPAKLKLAIIIIFFFFQFTFRSR